MKHLLPLILLTLLAACTDDDLATAIGSGDTADDAYFIIDNGIAATRTEYDNLDIDHTAFLEGDRLGIFALNADGTAVTGQPTNVPYVVSRSLHMQTGVERLALVAETRTELARGAAQYLIYFPYDATATLDKVKAYTYAVKTDQRGDAAYETSDLLWDMAQPATDGKVHVTMDHVMAQFILTLDDTHYSIEPGARLLSQPTTTQNANLAAADLASQHYTAAAQPAANIEMWDFGYNSNGSRWFRCVTPACRTIPKGTPLIEATNRAGTTIRLKLRKDLTLKPGHNYYFALNRKPTPLPEIGDDDSWVLDVLDPETGEPVGLLCREYIRYQPQNTDAFAPDKVTHPDDITLSFSGNDRSTDALGPLTISSQGWVFYNLKTLTGGDRIPDLSHGTVMRYLFDVRACQSSAGTSQQCCGDYPAPHYTDRDHMMHSAWTGGPQGMYMPYHGHDWINDRARRTGRSTTEAWMADFPNEFPDAAACATEDNARTNTQNADWYYEFWKDGGMHGGTVYWDGANNKIAAYTPYSGPRDPLTKKARISNETAYKHGHVSIPQDGSAPFVTYNPVTAGKYYDGNSSRVDGKKKPNKAGVLVPRYLVDCRKNIDDPKYHYKYDYYRYPIVKMGFNQFWMMKSLYATSYTDGTPLTCNNEFDSNGLMTNPQKKYSTSTPHPAGYAYPVHAADPNNPGDIRYCAYEKYGADGCRDRGTGLIYNYQALVGGKLKPESRLPHFNYVVPYEQDLQRTINYIGWLSGPKMMTKNVRMDNDNPPTPYEKIYELGGYTGFGAYCANVTGWNMRADGVILDTDQYGIGSDGGILLLSDSAPETDTQGQTVYHVPVFSFASWNCWHNGKTVDAYYREYPRKLTDIVNSWRYASVRFVATYDNQNYSAQHPAPATRAADAPEPRDVYVAFDVE